MLGKEIDIEFRWVGYVLEVSNGIARIENGPRTVFVEVSKLKDGKLASKDISMIASYHIS